MWVTVLVILATLALAALSYGADAKPKFLSAFTEAYPQAAGTQLDSCILCHTDPAHPGEDNLNQYGLDWENGDIGDKNFLAPALVNRDSDRDGVANGAEILQLSLPGDPTSSTPPSTTTTQPGTPPDGAGLYAARCASCHGPDGGNLKGTALARRTFINIVLNGSGGMPAQSGLTEADAGAIFDYVTGAVTTTTLPGTTTTTQAVGGATVFAQNCAACHGANGGNLVPTTLGRSQLVSIINNGTGSMPGFAWLGSAQVGAAADYLLSLSPSGATTTTAAPRSGASVYAASCALCHGADGGNLRGHHLSLAQITAVVTNGKGSMSGFAGRLSGTEISNVSQYVLSVGSGVTSTTAGTAVSGSDLYMQNCSPCHGLHGEGGVGGVLAGTTLGRAEIIRLTTDGRATMPAFGGRLSSAEIAAIADQVLSMSGSAAAPTPPDAAAVPPELEAGHDLFGRFCAGCHGAEGQGGLGGPVAGSNLSADRIRRIVLEGQGSMRGFAGQLTDDQVELIVGYVAALASGSLETASEAPTTDDTGVSAAPPPPNGDSSALPVVIVSLLAGLGAAGASILWARAGRKLTG